MEQLNVKAQPRERQHKLDNRRLRRQGQIPSVVYGGDGQPRSIVVSEHELDMILHGASRSSQVFNLALDGGNEQTILRTVDRHPVTSRLVHLDFQRIDIEKPIEIEVSVHAAGGDPKGVRLGGILEHVQRAVVVRCKPLEMPAFLEADLSQLDVHESFHVSDLKLPEGVVVVDAPETALFSIVAPALVKEEVPVAVEGAETAAAEPELITKKKETEED